MRAESGAVGMVPNLQMEVREGEGVFWRLGWLLVFGTCAVASTGAPMPTRVRTASRRAPRETIDSTPSAGASAPTTLGATHSVRARLPFAVPNKFFGTVEFRPSVDQEHGGHFFDHERVELGYQWGSRLRVSYVQDFFTFYQKTGIESFDGYFKIEVPRLLEIPEAEIAVDYESRLGLPTFQEKRDAGLIVFWRNSFKISKEFNRWFGISIQETPIFYAYSRAGYEVAPASAEEAASEANPWFENRFSVGPEFSFFAKRLSISLPVVFRATRFRNYNESANNNDNWLHAVGFFPEILYQVTSDFYLGATYESGSLVRSDFMLWNFSGAQNGISQLIFGLHF